MSSSGAISAQDFKNSNPHLYLSLAFVDIFLALTAVISNAVLLVTVFQDPHRNLWTPVTSLVISLSVCDMLAGSLTGFSSAAVNIAIYSRSGSTTLGIILVVSVAVTTNVIESCTIVAMSFDRWFVVTSPLRYRASLTATKVKVLIVVIWVYAFLFASLSTMGVPLDIFTLLYCHLHVSLPILVLTVIYRQTYRALQAHSSQIQNLSDGNTLMNTAHANRERKVTSAFLLVLLVFYSAFFAHFIALNVLIFHPSSAANKSFQTFHSLTTKLPLINYCINPFIYAWRIPKYKRAFKSVLGGCFRRNQRSSNLVPFSTLPGVRRNKISPTNI